MQETLNRIARYADKNNSLVMVPIDSINEKTRVQRVADMYAHIFSRQADFEVSHKMTPQHLHPGFVNLKFTSLLPVGFLSIFQGNSP